MARRSSPTCSRLPVGDKVSFRNDDPIFHNVFSLSKPNEFDAGLYRQGASYTKTFTPPRPVGGALQHPRVDARLHLRRRLPVLHAAAASGAFTIKRATRRLRAVRLARGRVEAGRAAVTVGAGGVRAVAVTVGGDKRAAPFVPDKSGKPRQSHLGY